MGHSDTACKLPLPLHHSPPNLNLIMTPLTRRRLTVPSAPKRDTASSDMEVYHLNPTRSSIRMVPLAIDLVLRGTSLDNMLRPGMRETTRLVMSALRKNSIVRTSEVAISREAGLRVFAVGAAHVVGAQILEDGDVEVVRAVVEEFVDVLFGNGGAGCDR